MSVPGIVVRVVGIVVLVPGIVVVVSGIVVLVGQGGVRQPAPSVDVNVATATALRPAKMLLTAPALYWMHTGMSEQSAPTGLTTADGLRLSSRANSWAAFLARSRDNLLLVVFCISGSVLPFTTMTAVPPEAITLLVSLTSLFCFLGASAAPFSTAPGLPEVGVRPLILP